MRPRLVAVGLSAAIGVAALAAGVGASVARRLDVLPGVPRDTWAMVTSFTDFGLLAYALAVLFLLVSVLLWRRGWVRIALLALSTLLVVVNGSSVLPDFVADRDPGASAAQLRVLSQNLLYGGADVSSVQAATAEADVVVLIEMTQPIADKLRSSGFDDTFPYASGDRLPARGPSGTRIYSRYPMTAGERLDPAGGGQNWRASVDAPGMGQITIAAVHPRRPTLGGETWWPAQQQVLEHVPSVRTVVAGDLNAVDSHPSLRQYVARGFRDADDLAGAGWQPTFPARGRVPPLIAIDHILVSADLTVTDFRRVRVAGTDHRGILAGVHLRGT